MDFDSIKDICNKIFLIDYIKDVRMGRKDDRLMSNITICEEIQDKCSVVYVIGNDPSISYLDYLDFFERNKNCEYIDHEFQFMKYSEINYDYIKITLIRNPKREIITPSNMYILYKLIDTLYKNDIDLKDIETYKDAIILKVKNIKDEVALMGFLEDILPKKVRSRI